MVAKIAGMDAMDKESVPGVAQRVGVVENIGLEMDVMVLLEELLRIIAYYPMYPMLDLPTVKNEQ